MIDTGIDDDTGKKIIKAVEKEVFRISAIISTHSHANHIGANSLIKARTSASVYSPDYEAALIHFYPRE